MSCTSMAWLDLQSAAATNLNPRCPSDSENASSSGYTLPWRCEVECRGLICRRDNCQSIVPSQTRHLWCRILPLPASCGGMGRGRHWDTVRWRLDTSSPSSTSWADSLLSRGLGLARGVWEKQLDAIINREKSSTTSLYIVEGKIWDKYFGGCLAELNIFIKYQSIWPPLVSAHLPGIPHCRQSWNRNIKNYKLLN